MEGERRIEQELTLWAAQQPRTEAAALMLRAAETIYRLRAELKYQQDSAAEFAAGRGGPLCQERCASAK